MSPPEKRPRVSQAQETSVEEKNGQFQRGVLNMMQLHPSGHVLAERVFERMPLEGFVDMKKILLPENEVGYDSLLSFGFCEVILNKFEKKEPLLRVLREEYESLTETRPRLSGVCEITSRLWNVKFNEKMKSKNNVDVYYDEPLLKMGAKFDNSTDFLVSTDRLYDETILEENGEETKSFNGKKFNPLNEHFASSSLYLFVYYLDRENPKIVKPKHIRTIELAKRFYHRFADTNVMHFRVCGNFLAVAKKWWREIGFRQAEVSYGVEFYDMEKSRRGEPDRIYNIRKLSALGWSYDPTERNSFDISDSDSEDSDSSDFCRYQKTCYFSENIFICSRDNGDGNFSIEIHEISSEGGVLLRKIELHTNPEPGVGNHPRENLFPPFGPVGPLDNLFIESIGNSSWNFYISTLRSRETFIIFYDKIQNVLNAKLEKEPQTEIPPPHPSGLPVNRLMKIYFTHGELDKAVKRLEKKLESEVNVYAHVRFFAEYDLVTEKTTAYYKFYA